MRYIATAHEIKEIENYVINEVGIPSLVLMERAALCVSEIVKQRFLPEQNICVVCGGGNNGADGVAIARQLMEDGYKIDVVLLGKPEKFSKEMNVQLSIMKNLEAPVYEKIPQKDYACFIDAIFGVGITREIVDEGILNALDTLRLSDAYIYSVDIPSGIHTDNGCIMGKGVKADETITFTCEKMGLCLYPGKEYAGKVIRKDIGITASVMEKIGTGHFAYEENDGTEFLKRAADGNKGTFGKVAVIAGNAEISGAAVLCAKAVLKSGAGMIKVLSNNMTLDIIRKTLPEAMVRSLDDEKIMAQYIQETIEWADSVVIGPGIGTDESAYLKMYHTLKDFPDNKSLIIDADGINLISKSDELKELTKKVNNVIYTPHLAELSRLIKVPLEQLKISLDEWMKEVVSENEAVYVCKDSVTRVYQNGKTIFINRFGNSGMATAGSGDVLAGIIAALTARNKANIFESAVLGVHLHSVAGDLAVLECGKNSLLAGDIIEALPGVLKKMEEFS